MTDLNPERLEAAARLICEEDYPGLDWWDTIADERDREAYRQRASGIISVYLDDSLVVVTDSNGQWPEGVNYGWWASRLTGSVEVVPTREEADVLIVPLALVGADKP